MDQGIYDIPFEEYLKIDAFSKSGADQIQKSPMHYQAYLRDGIEDTSSMILGRATHSGLLEPKKFYDSYIARPEGLDLRTKIGKEAFAELQAANPGKEMLSHDQYQQVDRMIHEVYSHAVASQLLTSGKAEQSLVWVDPEHKVLCKGRADYIRSDNVVIDIKTTVNASPKEFERSIGKYRYHVQNCVYSYGLQQILGSALESYIIIAIESDSPHGIGIYTLDDKTIDLGRALYRANLETYAECLKTGKWPGYSQEIKTLSVPPWAFTEAG